ncbi:DUF4279 domain-containing protein [Verrucomicrobiaceae bacterium N1E253]|uniref:DUF4279 domain-containing protein n=1 Tax=Oceaniferula marina TaxID=2748318 RepID=A0A851GKW8_9BACT|nr:DUF4279 domain-containing protein [Oceaniferula marina]NWK57779.1 DUF4279 domain-containing protein [Oceaniferula marina]
MNQPIYNDGYSACSETYSTLCIYHNEKLPSDVTARLGIEPDREILKEEAPTRHTKSNGWFFGTKGKLQSRDSRRHIDWIVDRLEAKKDDVLCMTNEGYDISIFSLWVSESANGGPKLSPYQMHRLSELNIEVSWDIYL